MSIPNEALQKLVQEIEIQAAAAQQQIGLARSQMTAKQRERRLVRLTLDEMESLPSEAVVYEGVGKMFAQLPVTDLRKKLDKQTTDLAAEVDRLNQRLLYLETTHKNSREHIEQMLQGR
ncbi:prefoldin subunit domain-containing protein [Sarocladium implicatum]|nr:prefoldin subunit domain-containing protein [Sarocladium implicatum]